jgi:hypothetical protein
MWKEMMTMNDSKNQNFTCTTLELHDALKAAWGEIDNLNEACDQWSDVCSNQSIVISDALTYLGDLEKQMLKGMPLHRPVLARIAKQIRDTLENTQIYDPCQGSPSCGNDTNP